jgi:MtN3 and saliva related transmembrane protein
VPLADTLALAATFWGIVMALSPTLQIRRMRQTQSSRDVSIPYLSVLCIGFVLWISYGLSIGNPALLIANSASLVVMIVTIAYALRLRRKAVPAD